MIAKPCPKALLFSSQRNPQEGRSILDSGVPIRTWFTAYKCMFTRKLAQLFGAVPKSPIPPKVTRVLIYTNTVSGLAASFRYSVVA